MHANEAGDCGLGVTIAGYGSSGAQSADHIERGRRRRQRRPAAVWRRHTRQLVRDISIHIVLATTPQLFE